MNARVASKILSIAISFLVPAAASLAQIAVHLTPPPAYRFGVEDFWKVSLMNPTKATYQIYLTGRATEQKDGLIVEATSTVFALPPGFKTVTARDLAPLHVTEHNPKYSSVVKSLGIVPTGVYEICVTVYNAVDDTPLGQMCVESNPLNLTQIELLEPEDGTRFSDGLGTQTLRHGKEELKTLLSEIPDGCDARTALWALLRALYPGPGATALETEEHISRPDNDPWGPGWLPEIAIKRGSAQKGIPQNGSPPNGSDAYLGAVDGLSDVPSFLSSVLSAQDPVRLLNALALSMRNPAGDATGIASVYEEDPAAPGAHASTLRQVPGGIVTFSWLSPSPLPQGARVTYTLRIAEIFGRQSPYDAIESNPGAMVLPGIPGTIVQLPLAARRLRPGISYAWSVDVYLNGTRIQTSEVRSFTFVEESALHHAKTSPRWRPSLTSTGDVPGLYEAQSAEGALRWRPMEKRKPALLASLFTDPDFLRGNPMFAEGDSSAMPPAFLFSGSARVEARYSSRAGNYSELPRNALSADIRPGVALYGLPFSASYQVSTMQDVNRQSMNSFGINFDFTGMRQGLESRLEQRLAEQQRLADLDAGQLANMANPERLTSSLDGYGAINAAERVFMSVRSFGVGTSYPSYTEHMLNGVPVTGMNLEVNPGILYAAFTASRNQRPVTNASYHRDLYAGRLGAGRKEASHFFVTALYVSDDPSSMSTDSLHAFLTPRENYVYGMDGRVELFKTHVAFEGEGAVSLFTRDKRDPQFTGSSVPDFVSALTTPRLSSAVDYMYSGRVVYTNQESATRLSAGVKMIGPGYASLGVPSLRTDQFGYEGKLDQQLFERRVTLGSFIRTYRDNLIDWKPATTTMTSWGVSAGLTIPRVPTLRVSYMPVLQQNNATDTLTRMRTDMRMLTVMTGYSYRIATIMASTICSYSGQRMQSRAMAGEYRNNSYLIGEMLMFRLPLTLNINTGLIESRSFGTYGMTRTVDVSASMPVGERVTVTAGTNAGFDRGNSERINLNGGATVTLSEVFALDMRVERTQYNAWSASTLSYREYLATAAIVARW
jgi:hypothetical protein